MKTGPKPIPKAKAKQNGYYRPSRHSDVIADVSGLDWIRPNTIPMAPDDLSEAAKEIWDYQLRLAANLEGYISSLDLTLFKEYCWVYGELQELEELVTSRVITTNGVRRIHPLYTQKQGLRKDFLALGSLFGFSPVSRSKLKLSKKTAEVQDPYADGI